MKQTDNANSVYPGSISVVSLFESIANNTGATVSILSKVNDTVANIWDSLNTRISNFTSNTQNKINFVRKKKESGINPVNTDASIYEILAGKKPLKTHIGIEQILTNIYDLLSNKSNGGANQNEAEKTTYKNLILVNFFASKLNKIISQDFIERLRAFESTIKNLFTTETALNGIKKFQVLSKSLANNLMVISDGANSASTNLDNMTKSLIKISLVMLMPLVNTAFRKLIATFNALKGAINNITKTIFIFIAALTFPGFMIGLNRFLDAFDRIHEKIGNGKSNLIYISNLKFLGLSLLGLATSLIIFNYVDWSSVGKLLAFIGGLSVIMRLYANTAKQSNQENTSDSDNSVLKKLSFGLISMGLALYSMNYVDWASTGKLLVFLSGLFITLRVFASTKNNAPSKGFLKLSIGISILLITVRAIGEINWVNALTTISGFVIGIGLVTMISNKFMGGGNGSQSALMGGKSSLTGLLGFAIGITILLIAVDAVKDLNWQNALILITFIAAVSFAVAAPSLIPKGKFGGQPIGGILGFTVGIALLLIAVDAAGEVNWTNAFYITGFIYAIVGAMYLMQTKLSGGVKGMATNIGGIVLLVGTVVGAMYLISKINVSNQQLTTFGVGTAIIVGASILIGMFSKLISRGSSIVMQLGIGTITLASALYVISKTNVTLEQLIMYGFGVSVIVGISYIIGLVSKNIKKSLVSIILLSVQTTMLAGVLWIVSKLDLDSDKMLSFSVSAGILTGTLLVISYVESSLKRTLKAVGLVTFSSLMLAGVFRIISALNLDFSKLLKFGATVIGFVGLSVVVGLFESVIKRATPILIMLGVASVIFASSLYIISVSNLSWEQLAMFGTTIVGFVAIASLLSLFAPVVAIGSATLILLSAGLIISAGALYVVASLDIDNEKLNQFGNSIKLLVTSISSNFGSILLALPAALLLIPISASILLAAGSLYAVSVLEVNQESIKNFGNGLKSVIETIDSFGLIQLGKTMAKSVMLIPISGAVILTATAMKLISMLQITPDNIKSFGESLKLFLANTSEAINQSLPTLKKISPGLEAVAKLSGAAASIASVIETYANMTVGEWGYNKTTGKLEIIKRKPITKQMLEGVGTGIGTMLLALIKPLTVISGEDEYWDFGNVKVKNPFGKRGFFGGSGSSHGVERIEKILNAYKLLPEIFSKLLNNQGLFDSDKIKVLGVNLSLVISQVINGLTQFMGWKPDKDKLEASLENATKLHSIYAKIGSIMKVNEYLAKVGLKSLFERFTKITYILNQIGGNIHLLNKFGAYKNLESVISNTKQLSKIYGNVGDSVTTISKLNMSQQKLSSDFESIRYLLNGTKSNMNLIATSTEFNKSYDNRLRNVSGFYTELSKISSFAGDVKIEKVVTQTERLLNNLGDRNKFAQINKNLKNTGNSIKQIASNINKINIPKAMALERNLKLLTESKSIQGIEKAIHELQKLIGQLVVAQKLQTTQGIQIVENTAKTAKSVQETTTLAQEDKAEKQRRLNMIAKAKAINEIEVDTPEGKLIKQIAQILREAATASSTTAFKVDLAHGGNQLDISNEFIKALTAFANQNNNAIPVKQKQF